MKKHFLKATLGLMGLMGTLTIGIVNAQEINKDIKLEATSTVANQTLKINKYFANAYTVDRGDGNTGNLTADTTHTYSTPGTYTITLSLSGANRWSFQNVSKQLVPINGTTTTGVKITYMPSLADGFGVNATTPGNYFFYNFNMNGALISLPDNSFDTSNITTAGNSFFRGFNDEGALISLPEGSFDTSNITTVGDYFFRAFNYKGLLTSLPTGSFNISHITTVGNNFFANFNFSGALISLPNSSFDTSNIKTIGNNFFWQFNTYGSLQSLPNNSFNISNISGSIGNEFFRNFNFYGQLTNLPKDSFNISNISGSVGTRFFYGFNCGGQLTSLPTGSFDTSHITAVGERFFEAFNSHGQLISLPEGSFNISNITTVGDYFFEYFNRNGNLISLPKNSFDISYITTVGDNFFTSFNQAGQLTSLPNGSFRLGTGLLIVGHNFFRAFNSNGILTSLPTGSFDISNITMVGEDFFRTFNNSGQITSLPDGSFNTSNITVVGNNFFYQFDNNGSLTDLPYSFTMNSTGASVTGGYRNAFNSPNYTLNKKVSDLVSGMTVPLDDRDTFSDNQPGRCGVHENWLVNPAGICDLTVTFNANGGTEIDPESASSGDKIILPETTKTGYILDGWYDELSGGNKVGDAGDTFIVGGNQILYASRKPNQYTITLDIDGILTAITGDYGSPVNKPSNPSKNGYTFKGWEPEIPDTMPAENMTVKAKWERNGSSGGGGGGGGSSSSSSTGSNTTPGSDTSNNTGNQQTGSGANSSTGNQNEQPTTGTNIKESEANTGNNIQTGNQVDSPDNSSEGQEILSPSDNSFTKEQKDAYTFAHEKGITTMPTIQKAEMNSSLTRIAMAKMLSQYAINILGKKPKTRVIPKFNDVTEKMDSDYDDGVTLAYQLGIMGQNMPNNRFRPNDEVSRAEFATALSRMLYNTSDGKYKSTSEYYVNHIKKLKEEGIITKDAPKMKELRGYVMIMLMRSAK